MVKGDEWKTGRDTALERDKTTTLLNSLQFPLGLALLWFLYYFAHKPNSIFIIYLTFLG